MKNLTIIAAAYMAAVSASADVPVRNWRYSPIPVVSPFANDSVDSKGNKFKAADLLASPAMRRLPSATAVTADTAGTVTLQHPAKGRVALNIFDTGMRAARFAKGNIKVTSPLPFAVYVDGKEVVRKESVEDSLGTASERRAAVRFEPEHDYRLNVRFLVQPDDSVDAVATVVYVADAGYDSIPVLFDADMKRRFALDDTQFTSRVTDMSLNDNGRYLIAKVYTQFDNETNGYKARVLDAKTGKIINGNIPWSSQWMPDGNLLYYNVKTDKGYDIYALDVTDGTERLLLSEMPEKDIAFSHDASYVIYSVSDDGVKEDGPLRRYLSPDDRMPGNRRNTHLVKRDVATGLSQQLTFGRHSTYLSDIAPDDSRIIVFTTSENPMRRPFYDQTIYILDLNTMQADTLVGPSPQFVNTAQFSPDGKKILFTGSPNAFDGLGKNCGDHPIANDFDIQMYVMDLGDRKVTPVTRDFNPSVASVIGWNRADGNIYFLGEEGFGQNIYKYDVKARTFSRIPAGVTYVSRADMAAGNAGSVVYTGQSYDNAGAGYITDIRSGRVTELLAPDAERLAGVRLGAFEPWNFTARDGTLIEGYICLPPDFDPEKKYPLIVYYYGGTSPSNTTILQPYTPQLFASRDYVVYVLNPSGTTGYGQEFSARHVNAWGKYTADDIIEGVQKFCQAHPFVDEKRIGCLGASYGGFMTQLLQTKTPLFAAAVSHAGISNVTSYWGEGYWGYSYNSVAAADSYPWSNPDLYAQGSLFNADKINTPLLLLHGTADTNVPVGESIQLFNALRVLGKDVEFVTVDGENHFIADYPKRIKWHNTIMAFFAKHLQNSPQWWDDLYPVK